MDKVNSILDSLAPVKTILVRTHCVPVLEEGIKKLQAERNKAHEQAARSDSPEEWRLYRTL